jgi:DNA-binding beta-propeller fold protein YncE
MRVFMSAAVLLVLFFFFLAIQPRSSQDPLSMLRAIELPRVEGRIDHLALDPTGEKLFVAALGNNTVEVLDVKTGSHLKSLPGFREPQGIAGVPDAQAVAVANGQGDGVQLISASDYRSVKAIALGDDSDNVRYDAAAKKLYVGYGDGALAAIKPADGKVTGIARLAGHPESFQLERTGPRIFVNVPTAEHIAVVDRNAMAITARWSVAGAKSNFPMALDESNHRLFVGCRKPGKVLVYDTTNGKELGASDIVGDTDDLFYDSQRKRLYVAGGEGFIDVLDATAPVALTRVARVTTAPGARTALFASEQGRLYLAVPHRGAQRAEVRVYEVRE